MKTESLIIQSSPKNKDEWTDCLKANSESGGTDFLVNLKTSGSYKYSDYRLVKRLVIEDVLAEI